MAALSTPSRTPPRTRSPTPRRTSAPSSVHSGSPPRCRCGNRPNGPGCPIRTLSQDRTRPAQTVGRRARTDRQRGPPVGRGAVRCAGILEERPASLVSDALIADDAISERQKQMLLGDLRILPQGETPKRPSQGLLQGVRIATGRSRPTRKRQHMTDNRLTAAFGQVADIVEQLRDRGEVVSGQVAGRLSSGVEDAKESAQTRPRSGAGRLR